jgi:hypothetical protein
LIVLIKTGPTDPQLNWGTTKLGNRAHRSPTKLGNLIVLIKTGATDPQLSWGIILIINIIILHNDNSNDTNNKNNNNNDNNNNYNNNMY